MSDERPPGLGPRRGTASADDGLEIEAQRLVVRSTQAQGLQVRVEDPVVLQAVARALSPRVQRLDQRSA